MEKPLKLAETFLAHARMRVALPGGTAELEGLLERAVQAGHEKWPVIALPAELFVRHLAERLFAKGEGGRIEQLPEQPYLADLYLACSCAREIPAAIEAFESKYLAKLPEMLGYLRLPTAAIDEVRQDVRVKLLVRQDDGGCRIAQYSGHGPLVSWVRVIATNIANKQLTAPRESSEEDDRAALEALPAPGLDPEIDLIKRRYQPEFLRAVRESFSALTSDERYQLQLYHIHQLSTPQMGELFRVSQATASRRLKIARQRLYEGAKQRLQERLGLSTRDFESLLVVLKSQLDMSLGQILKGKHEGDDDEED